MYPVITAPRHSSMAPLPEGFGNTQWSALYDALVFDIAGMGSTTIFFLLQLPKLCLYINQRFRHQCLGIGSLGCYGDFIV